MAYPEGFPSIYVVLGASPHSWPIPKDFHPMTKWCHTTRNTTILFAGIRPFRIAPFYVTRSYEITLFDLSYSGAPQNAHRTPEQPAPMRTKPWGLNAYIRGMKSDIGLGYAQHNTSHAPK